MFKFLPRADEHDDNVMVRMQPFDSSITSNLLAGWLQKPWEENTEAIVLPVGGLRDGHVLELVRLSSKKHRGSEITSLGVILWCWLYRLLVGLVFL